MQTGLIAVVVAACCGQATAQPVYELIRLESGDMLATHAWDITNSGMVVGSGVDRAGYERGVLWTAAGMRVLPTPVGFDNVRLVGGNNAGSAVAWLENADAGYSAGVWSGEAWTVVEPWAGFEHVWLESVNDAGVAVGIMDPAWGGPTPIRVRDGVVEQLPVLPNWEGARPLRELDDGTIIGVAGIAQYTLSVVRWVDGQPEEVQPPAGVGAFGVSGSGWGGHVAMYDALENTGSWVWDGDGWFKPDGIVDLNGYIQGFNRGGDFVANSWWDSGALLGLGGEIYLVEDLVDLPDDARSVYFVSMNDAGAAAGFMHTQSTTWATVLRPVPTPATLALLGMGGLLSGRRRRYRVCSACVAACGAGAAAGPPRYFVDVVGSIDGPSRSYFAIDDHGRVVGTIDNEAVIWEAGHVTVLASPPGASRVIATAISAGGIAGVAWIGNDEFVVLWQDEEVLTFPAFDGDSIDVQAISTAGHIPGSYHRYSEGRSAFVWHDGELTALNDLGRPGFTVAWDVNASGVVVGRSKDVDGNPRACRWTDAQASDLGCLPGHLYSDAQRINDLGEIAGISRSADDLKLPVIWQEGEISELPSALPIDRVWGLNNRGTIIGRHDVGGVTVEFVWIDGVQYVIEDRLISEEGWQITFAESLNESGQILAFGSLDGTDYGVVLTAACAGDFNLDRAVDTRDVVAFLSAWAAGDGGADFDGDGVVDTRDVTAFLGAWAAGCG
jgi:probable HAF family extracellular repeat protein